MPKDSKAALHDPRVVFRAILGVLLAVNLAAAVLAFRPFGGWPTTFAAAGPICSPGSLNWRRAWPPLNNWSVKVETAARLKQTPLPFGNVSEW
jgi:hypothetical protein